MIKRIIIGALPVFLGGLIYITYRTKSLIMFDWFDKIGLSEYVVVLRTNKQLLNLELPNWIKYSLPDALWLFSFTYITLIIWRCQLNKQSVFWIMLAPIIGLFSELGQLLGFVPGTFDRVDLILLIIAALLPLTFITQTQFKTIKTKNV
ncbi:hypothetical protein [Wenyingzhuangia aestuarii]|uniref:hypothetical protein n=1 Tax=Wenyingzhuangia aestuarii TaxID=1647582 RepID=UPI0014387993|nr:hypothetical protein [Wenyingzhuangia aestuarii]NJB83637.1 hypothetical protein [Wenyingzhuangia aestuarii]